jgi:F420-0:gamma-glutamyl ligase
MPNPRSIQLLPIHHIPEIRPGDNLSRILLAAAKKSKITFQQNDILVLAQKIISKSENRLIDLTTITPSQRAIDIAAASDNDRSRKDPRLVEIILRESLGLTNVAIGTYGISPMEDLRGTRDMHKKPLHATIIAVADELAAAAGLLMQKSAATPAILIRNYTYKPSHDPATTIIRPRELDLFR